MGVTAADVVSRVAAYSYPYLTEADLADGVAQALAGAGDWSLERDVRLGSQAERIDLVLTTTDGLRVGIEARVEGPAASIRRQLMRFSKTGRVDALVLVTTRAAHQRDLQDWVMNGLPHAVPLTVVRARWL
jgi:hypothetical protein